MSLISLETKFLDFCQSFIPARISILIAVSGGSDSVALLRLFCKYMTHLTVKKIGVIHVNHGLRGAESDGDEQFVRELALSMGIPFFIKRLVCPDPDGAGIELWARRERYAFFNSVRESGGFDWIATGHTLDDQAETVLMRILRGSGIRGLRGILPVREDNVCRPLIKCKKSEIETWLKSQNQTFKFDSSNSNTKYRRNQIRIDMLPQLKALSLDIVENLGSISDQMSFLWEKLAPEIDRWTNAFVKRDTSGLISIKKGGFSDGNIAREGLRSLFEAEGIGYTKSHIELLIQNAGKRGYFLLPGHWIYCSDRENLMIFKQGVASVFNCELSFPGVSVFHNLNRAFTISTSLISDSVDISKELHSIIVDRDTFDENLVYRTVKADDRFQPFGRKNSVKVLEFLSKQGYTKPVRQNMGIIADQYNKVVWVPAVRVNEQCKVTENTRRVVKISMKTIDVNI